MQTLSRIERVSYWDCLTTSVTLKSRVSTELFDVRNVVEIHGHESITESKLDDDIQAGREASTCPHQKREKRHELGPLLEQEEGRGLDTFKRRETRHGLGPFFERKTRRGLGPILVTESRSDLCLLY